MNDNGLYCGFVEDNQDPLKIGRLKIRIPHLHGTDPNNTEFIPTAGLQWSYPCMPFYAGFDCGSFIIPPVGTYVWVIPMSGKNSHYVYFGGVYGNGATSPKPMNSLDPNNSDGVSMGQYFTPVGISEIPSDVKSLEYGQAGVIFKSQKGHTVLYSDQDGAEFFEIIDRSGQSIKFECPVSKKSNIRNASRRTSNTLLGGTIRITSGSSQIEMNSDHILLKSKNSTIEI